MAQPRVHHLWASAEASRDVLDVILLLRRPEIAFAFWRLHTPLSHSELIVGENHCAPSGACPLGFGAAVQDSTFAWSCFILLDLAPCSGLGRSSLDPDPLPRPRPCICQLLVFRSFSQQPRCLHHGLWHGPLLAARPQVDRPPYTKTHALRVSSKSIRQGSQVAKGSARIWVVC